MQITLRGKVALVTGAGSGIGRGVSKILAAAGAGVVVNDIHVAGGRDTVAQIAAAGGQAVFVEADVASVAACEAMMRQAAAHLAAGRLGGADAAGRAARDADAAPALHLLVNNAAIEIFKGLEGTTSEEWDRLVAIDLKSIYAVTRAALPMLQRAGRDADGASVVNIASVHAQATLPLQLAYAACKGGVVAMTRALALELGPMGIHVNSVSPGFVDTPMVKQWFDLQADPAAERRRVNALHAVGRIGTPEDIGHLVAFLASPLARFIAGANLTIDGGLMARLQH